MRGTGSSGQRRLRRRCGAVPRLSSCEGRRSCRRLLGLSSEEASLTGAGASLPRVTSKGRTASPEFSLPTMHPPPASIRSLELATFHAPHRHTTQPTQKTPESGGLLALDIHSFIPTAPFRSALARLRQLDAYTAPVRNRSD